jgi:competence protein ComEC
MSFKFFKQPFLVLTIFLCVGILIGFELVEWQEIFLSGIIFIFFTALFCYWMKRLNNGVVLLIASIGFVLIGALLIQSRGGAWEKNHMDTFYQKGDLLLVKMREVGHSDREWKKMTGDIQQVYSDNSNFDVKIPAVLFLKSGSYECETGDVILISSELIKIKNSGNPGEFDAENYWSKKGFNHMVFVGEDEYRLIQHEELPWYSQQTSHLRNYLKASLEENLKGKELAIALALILGDKSLLDSEITTSFTNTGAMHVLAVSGLHIGIIMQILMVILSRFSKILSRKKAVIIVVIIMWIYAIVTGLSPSVLRAVFMFSVLALSQLTGKNHNSINSLFFTAFVLMLFDPYTLYDIGFQLSFLAMLGIFLLYKPIEQLLFVENKWLMKVWQGTAIGFAAQLMTTPLSLYYFHQFPNYFVLTNIGLMASSGLILGLGIVLFTISWWTSIARFTGLILTFIIFVSLAFIEWVEDLPGAVAYGFEVSIGLVFILGILILFLFLWVKKQSHIVIAFASGLILLITIVFQRYQNMNVNEVCVFNARQVIITVRKNNQLFCFYKSKPEEEEKVKFAVQGYLKLHPSEIHYYSLNRKNWKVNSSKTSISVRKEKNSVEFDVNGKKYSVLLYDYSDVKNSNSIKIGMPWMEATVDHSLKNGAYIQSI